MYLQEKVTKNKRKKREKKTVQYYNEYHPPKDITKSYQPLKKAFEQDGAINFNQQRS